MKSGPTERRFPKYSVILYLRFRSILLFARRRVILRIMTSSSQWSSFDRTRHGVESNWVPPDHRQFVDCSISFPNVSRLRVRAFSEVKWTRTHYDRRFTLIPFYFFIIFLRTQKKTWRNIESKEKPANSNFPRYNKQYDFNRRKFRTGCSEIRIDGSPRKFFFVQIFRT